MCIPVSMVQNEGTKSSLPFEVVDNIIDVAIKTLDPPTISSIALLSHDFRLSANTSRFSSIIFDTKGSSFARETARISGLSNLIESENHIETLNGMNTCITSFTLKLNALAEPGEMKAFFEDGSLALIFRNLFRQPPMSTSARRRLAIEMTDVQVGGIEYRGSIVTRMADCRSFGEDLSREFSELVKTSYLNDISLVNLIGVPPDFLQRSRIQHLDLFGIGTNPDASESQLDNLFGPPIQLKTLSIDPFLARYKVLLMLICPRSLPTPETFSQITSITFKTSFMMPLGDMQKILSQTRCLESLTIQINGRFSAWIPPNFTPFQYEDLKRLKILRIDIKNLRQNPFPYFTRYLGRLAPPVLEVIQLNLRQRYERQDTVADQLDHLWTFRQIAETETLDEHLANPFYHGVVTVEIRVAAEIYQEDLREPVSLVERDELRSWQRDFQDHLTSSFPKCRDAHPSLEMRISVDDSGGE